jgi:hypothetical protein
LFKFAPAIVVAGAMALVALISVCRSAKARGVPPVLALLHSWAWIGVLSVTIVPDTFSMQGILDGTRVSVARVCYVESSPLDILSTGEARLNTLLFVPVGLLAVLAFRRSLAALVTGIFGAAAIEALLLHLWVGAVRLTQYTPSPVRILRC